MLKGVKIVTEEIEKDVTFLVDVDPLFISLVKHGANQQPFKVIKQNGFAKANKIDAKTVGFIDTNLGIDHALALVNDLDVYFHIDGGGAFPSIQDNCSGDGFEGINKVDDIGGVLDKDFIVITDCYFGQLADKLRAEGKAVFGPSYEWTRIENERAYGWKRLKEMGVGVPDGVIMRRMEELLEYIQKNQNGERLFFVKVSRYRGNRETGAGVLNEDEAMTAITQAGYGPYLADLEVLVQDRCLGVEIGFDAFFNGKEFLRPYLYTVEVKGSGTLGVWIESNGIDDFILGKIKQSLADTNYRGNISFEFFYDGKQVYCHDPTARMPFPCSAIQAHLIRNYAEVLYAVANGGDVGVEVGSKYVAQVGVYTEEDTTWRPIHFPEEIRDRVGFRRVVIKGGHYYFVPGDNVVATAVGEGGTPEEAIEDASIIADQIECSNTYVPADFYHKALKVVAELSQMEESMRFE